MRSFNVSGMSCAACSARVEKAVSALEGVDSCAVNLLTNSMAVEGSATDEQIICAVVNAGYGASLKVTETVENVNKDSHIKEKNGLVCRLIASVALLAPLMYFSMGH